MENEKRSLRFGRGCLVCLTIVSTFSVLCAPGLAQSSPKQVGAKDADSSQSKSEKARRLKLMRNLAQGVSISEIGDEAKEVKRISEPLFRYDDPARGNPDGTVWGWGSTGRPAALLVIYSKGNGIWNGETISLSNHRIRNTDPGRLAWESRGPGLKMQPIPNAPLLKASATQRERQLRQLARRFSAYEEWDNNGTTKLQRYTLRLLTQPIHRYSDPKRGLDEGGLFLFSYGGNPEIVMALEARRDDKAMAEWRCGFGRISWAALHVLIDGKKEVWAEPVIRGSSDAYLFRTLEVPR